MNWAFRPDRIRLVAMRQLISVGARTQGPPCIFTISPESYAAQHIREFARDAEKALQHDLALIGASRAPGTVEVFLVDSCAFPFALGHASYGHVDFGGRGHLGCGDVPRAERGCDRGGLSSDGQAASAPRTGGHVLGGG